MKDINLIRRVLLKQITLLHSDLLTDDYWAAVHEAHKRCKRIRAIIRLVRPVAEAFYERENKAFRKLAHSLSALRDEDASRKVFTEVFQVEGKGANGFSALRDALKCGRKSARAGQIMILAGASKKAEEAKERFRNFEWPKGKSVDLFTKGLRQSYKRGREAMIQAYRCKKEAAFHEWRKRAKDLDYQIQILPKGSQIIVETWRKDLEGLGHVLGQKHDLMILRKTLGNKSRRSLYQRRLKVFSSVVGPQGKQLIDEANVLGRRVYEAKSSVFMKRLVSS